MRRSSIVALSLLGVGGTALAASSFTGGRCERVYPSMSQCIAAHDASRCTEQTRTGPDGKLTTVGVGPDRSCSAWHGGGVYFMPGYWGSTYHSGYYAPGGGSARTSVAPGSTVGGSQRGGFGSTGSRFYSGS